MSMIETVSDVMNSFLSRREITCNFRGLGGKLKKKEAVDMITKEFSLADKTVIAINMKNQTGRPNVTGMFYIYESEELAKKQVDPTIFERLEKNQKLKKQRLKHLLKKQKAPAEEAKAEAPAEETVAETPAEETVAETPAEEAKAETPAEEAVAETEKKE